MSEVLSGVEDPLELLLRPGSLSVLDELDAAAAKGIQIIQGHFFSEPLRADELAGADLIGDRAHCG